MLQDTAVFSKAVFITRYQLRDISALQRSWSLFFLGCQVMIGPGQDAARLVNICYHWCC